MVLNLASVYSASFMGICVVTEWLIIHEKENQEKNGWNFQKLSVLLVWFGLAFFLKNGYSSAKGKASEPFETLRKCLLLLLQCWDVPLRLTLLTVFQWIYEQITFLMLLLRNWVNNSRHTNILQKTEKYLTAWYLTKKVSLKLSQAIKYDICSIKTTVYEAAAWSEVV